VFLANKPNILAQVCQKLADDKVNIRALSMMDASEHGVLRLVVENPDDARRTLEGLNVAMTETTVLLTMLPNRPGAMADVVERLASNHVAVNYAYCTAGAPGGQTMGVFRVSDLKRAMQVLGERHPRRKMMVSPRPVIRPRRK
jgi:hypothetical protein